jgi:peptidoglycan/xylan/chitin deacetylase (PgdA/CDA1 family)
MKAFAKRLVWHAFRSVIPFQIWPVLSRVSLVVPYYHMVSNDHIAHVRHLYRFRNVAEFESDLDFLLRRFVSMELEDIVAMLNGKGQLSQRCFHLTFDDGFREMYEVVAPILSRKGIPATFFLNTAFLDQQGMAHHNKISLLIDCMQRQLPSDALRKIEALLPPAKAGESLKSRLLSIRHADKWIVEAIAIIAEVDFNEYLSTARPYLSSEQVRGLLKQGFSIGAHSIDHPLYADLPLKEQIRQTRVSVDFIESRFGVHTRAFAFPYTDAGVRPEFFDAMLTTGVLDASFGTGRLVRHFHPRNIERFSMENCSDTAEAIVAREYARAVYHGCLHRFDPIHT